MIKPDERSMLVGALAIPPPPLIPWPSGQNRKRRESILTKWERRGWTDCGVSLATSWLTPEGRIKAAAFLEANPTKGTQ